ncbi:Voltage-gated hydrogen channel 1 [Echinococcus granulosus]|nr:Voltage-gated hydrogen channel 1 [Echinococcus granulosus]
MKRMIEKSLRQQRIQQSQLNQQRRGTLEKMTSVISEESRETDDLGRYSGYNYELDWANSKTFIKQLAKDNIDPSLLNEELQRHAESRRRQSWRTRCLGRFRSNAAQILLCLLVLIDSGIVISEIILEIRSIQNYKELFDIHAQHLTYLMATHNFRWTGSWCSSTGIASDNVYSDRHTQRIHTTQSHYQAVFPLGSTASMDEHQLAVLGDFIQCWQTYVNSATRIQENGMGYKGCDSVLRQRCAQLNATEIRPPDTSTLEMTNPAMLHHASEVMHFVSIGVTGLFIAFTVLKIVCLGRKFFTNIYEVTDALVILVSFVSDISYIKLDSQEISAMVILLLWRIVRLINAMLMYERQRCEFRVILQKRARRLQERKVDNLQRNKELFQKHITNLEELARNLGCSEESIRDCKPRYVYHSKEQTQNALKSIAALTTGFMGGLVGAPLAQKESIARFTANSPPAHSANQVSQSSLAAGDTCSSGAYDSLNSCKGFLTSFTHEDGASSPGSLSSLPSSSRRELMVRSQAENLVRNVLLHQLSNAIEESEAAFCHQQCFSPRRKSSGPERPERRLLKGFLGGAYHKQVSFEGRKERVKSLDLGIAPLHNRRRQTLGPLSKLSIHLSHRGLINPPYQKHHQVTNAAFDTDESESASIRLNLPHQHFLTLPEESASRSTNSSQPPLPTAPILQINEVETHDEDGDNGDEDEGGSIGDEGSVKGICGDGRDSKVCLEGKTKNKRRRRRKRASNASGSCRSSEGISVTAAPVNGMYGLTRRNSYCPMRLVPPDKQQLLLPERKARSENGSQPTIVRTSSERRFYVSTVPPSNSLEIVHTSKALSGSVVVP